MTTQCSCGADLEADERYCSICGKAVVVAPLPQKPVTEATAPPTPPTPPTSTYQHPVLQGGVYHCPVCNGLLQPLLSACQTCHVRFLQPVARPTPPVSIPTEAKSAVHCVKCGGRIGRQNAFCTSCGAPAPQKAIIPEAPNSSAATESIQSIRNQATAAAWSVPCPKCGRAEKVIEIAHPEMSLDNHIRPPVSGYKSIGDVVIGGLMTIVIDGLVVTPIKKKINESRANQRKAQDLHRYFCQGCKIQWTAQGPG